MPGVLILVAWDNMSGDGLAQGSRMTAFLNHLGRSERGMNWNAMGDGTQRGFLNVKMQARSLN